MIVRENRIDFEHDGKKYFVKVTVLEDKTVVKVFEEDGKAANRFSYAVDHSASSDVADKYLQSGVDHQIGIAMSDVWSGLH